MAEMTTRLTQHNTRDASVAPSVGSIIYVPAAGGGWDELVISVPAANVRNSLAIDNGETSPSWKAILDGTNPADIAAAASPGTSLIASHRDHIHKLGIITTKGDLLTWTTLPARLAVGSNDQVLIADSAQSEGMKWGALPSTTASFESDIPLGRFVAGEGTPTSELAGTKVAAWKFDDTTQESIDGAFEVPQNYSSGGSIKLYYIMDSAITNAVRWQVGVLATIEGEDFDAAASTAVENDTVQATTATKLGVLTLTPTHTYAAGDLVRLRVTRDADGVGDTAVGDAWLVGVGFSYTGTAVGGGGGGGAPAAAEYWVESAHADLSAEVVVGTTGITQTTYAARQAAAKAGRLWFPSFGDATIWSRDDGTNWDEYYPSIALFGVADRPTTWNNQGAATVSTTTGGELLTVPASASINQRLLEKVAPATPYTVTILVQRFYKLANVAFLHLGFRDSTTDRRSLFRIGFNTSDKIDRVQSSSATVDVAASSSVPVPNVPFLWFRVTDNGTNHLFEYSCDNENWLTFLTESRTTYTATPDRVCWGGDSRNSSPVYLRLLSWRET